MLRFFTILLIVHLCASRADAVDLSLSDDAAIYSATSAGYRGSRDKLIEIGREREALYLAKGMAGECRYGDIDCALGAVGVTVMTRAAIARSTPGEILSTPYQYPGFRSSPLLRRKAELREKIKRILPVARFIIAGGLNGRYEPSTHYALEKALLRSKWGKAFIKDGYSFYRLPDGHLVLAGIAKFRRPRRGIG